MQLHIGSDHAGLELKAILINHLENAGHQVTDHGPNSYDEFDDYPVFCIPAAEATVANPDSLGIVIGGSGNGEQMAANKVRGARAALVWNKETSALAREHNNANIISLGGRMHTPEFCMELIDTFIATPFSAEKRHIRRIDLISQYENQRIN